MATNLLHGREQTAGSAHVGTEIIWRAGGLKEPLFLGCALWSLSV